MAKQLGERFGISACFPDLKEMLHAISPDVVHITTPPESHYSLARQCLESGSHVYLEKPFTITAGEAESLIQLAEDCGLKITVGHNYQFTLEMLEMRRLVEKGFLGGRPVHLESYWSYNLGDSRYASAFLASRAHWVSCRVRGKRGFHGASCPPGLRRRDSKPRLRASAPPSAPPAAWRGRWQ